MIDGAAETVEMTVVLDCFKPTSFNAWLDNCKEKRAQIIDLLKSLRDLLKKETLEHIFKDFKEYVSETAGFDNQARYNQGRLFFEVASSFVGVSEIKSALKGGNLALVVSETLKKAPKESLKIITSTKKITSKTAKEIIEEIKLVRVGKVGDDVSSYIDNIFKGARQRSIDRFGKEVEDLIYVKFNKNGGAVAEIIDHFGIEGLNALKKVDNIDDVINELLKGKIAYRHIDSSANYIEELKATGIIKERKGKDFTYFSLDKIDNPIDAIDKMQLNGDFTDAIWRAEFEATQLVGKTKFPKAKWNNAEYIEVLTHSYPNFGSGGASQFITQSEIKLTRMVNLKTGEIINFK